MRNQSFFLIHVHIIVDRVQQKPINITSIRVHQKKKKLPKNYLLIAHIVYVCNTYKKLRYFKLTFYMPNLILQYTNYVYTTLRHK